jgi:type IV pilus assembly protein PilB
LASKVIKRRLPDLLLEQNLVSEDQLRECIALQRNSGQNLAHILVERGYLAEEDLVVTLSEQLGIPHIRVANYTIPKEALSEVPETLARQHLMLPISITGDVLTLAMANPLNIMALDDLRMLTSFDIEPVVAVESELIAAIEKNYGGGKAHDLYDEIVNGTTNDKDLDVVEDEEGVEDVSELETGAEDEPVKRLARLILFNALELGASDIHIEPFEKIVRLRYRIDGTLEEAKGPPKSLQQNLIARIKILSGCRIDEHRLPQDGRFRIRYNNRDIDFRVAFLPCKYGQKIVLRVLDKSSLTLNLDELGFEPQPMAAFHDALDLPHGMLLITGPTGSGKTTTLYSALHKLNSIDINIVTVEDPIEYELFGVNQVQVHSQIGLTFAEALRQILRQDPDVVMVGEIRDHETADVAVKAALTGHLVLSTLHTNDAAGVFPRLVDMGVEPFLVQSSVALAAAQRLLKKICPFCKEPLHVPKDVLERIGYEPSDFDGEPTFMRGRGCGKCKNTGYKGRVAVVEAMPNYPDIHELVMNRASGNQIMAAAQRCGMRSLRQNALSKAARGITTIEQVLESTTEPGH